MHIFSKTMVRKVSTLIPVICAAMLLALRAGPAAAHNCGSSSVTIDPQNPTVDVGGQVNFSASVSGFKGQKTYDWTFEQGSPPSSSNSSETVTYNSAGTWNVTVHVVGAKGGDCTDDTTVTVGAAGADPVCTIDTPANDPVNILTGQSVNYSGTATDSDGTVVSWTWTFGDPAIPDATVEDPGPVTYNTTGSYQTTFTATDNDGRTCAQQTRTINVSEPGAPPPPITQRDFKILMNYELGMHCTGFEFAYCCVLPVYNSILTQVVLEQDSPLNQVDWPYLLEGDPNLGRNLDVLGRETVVRDLALDADGNFKKYVMTYKHEAQPRNDGNGKAQLSTLISDVEGNSLLAWNTRVDAAARDGNGALLQFDGGSDTYPATAIPGTYNGAYGVVRGDGSYDTHGNTFNVPIDNFQNAIWNHLYIYTDTEGSFSCVNDPDKHCYALAADPDAECDSSPGAGDGVCGINSLESNKVRLGLDIDYPVNVGPGGHPMGPVGTPLNNVLTFSGDTGTVVFTQMKLLENLPVMLTSPQIWEALGLPLTPFEDSIDFFGDPGLVDEDSIRPFVKMVAELHEADCLSDDTCTIGVAVMDSAGEPVQGFGTAPIDIPNCERCHSAFDTTNSPNVSGTRQAGLVQLEIDYWKAYYAIDPGAGDHDWYARLKGAAISILATHDDDNNTNFLDNFPAVGDIDAGGNPVGIIAAGTPFDPLNELGGLSEPLGTANCLVNKLPTGPACTQHSDCGGGTDGICDLPQNTRIGHESVMCHKCHADNVIAVVKSAYRNPTHTALIPPLTDAIHHRHRSNSEGGQIVFHDAKGRDGACQGCHPAHRSDGDMTGYPICGPDDPCPEGDNFYASLDNRDARGGCFVGRDVHSNPLKDAEATTDSHLNPVGQWLVDNVVSDSGTWKGIWCTNCHTQVSQELWKAENVEDLVHSQPGDPGNVRMPLSGQVEGGTLSDVVAAVNTSLGTAYTDTMFMEWLDPGTHRATDRTHDIWKPDPGLCSYVAEYFTAPLSKGISAVHDGNVATIEVNTAGTGSCSTGEGIGPVDCSAEGGPVFYICGSTDNATDADFSVNILDFCTTDDCLAAAGTGLPGSSLAVRVPMSAATDGRDHWLAPGEPHCADCHHAPFVEQSGNITNYPPFNYPRKASLMRYTKGHQGITCQGCHESIHGLYPVTPPGSVSGGTLAIDQTSWDQAGALNEDGSHGPLKCDTCHEAGADGIPNWVRGLEYTYDGVTTGVSGSFDTAVSWMHTYTEETSPLESVCLNCHDVKQSQGGEPWDEISSTNKKWVEHSYRGRVSRGSMTAAELNSPQGHVSGDPDFEDPLTTLCVDCHRDRSDKVACTSDKWKNHLINGRADEKVWEYVSTMLAGSTCGW